MTTSATGNSTTALLVMDFQQSVVERLGNPEVLDAASRAVAKAREHGLLVIYVRICFRPGYPEVAASNVTFARILQSGIDFTDGSAATRLHPVFEPRPDEPVVIKRRVSAFAASDLQVILQARGIEVLVLAGIATSGVVLSTTREAADRDYRLVVLSDACSDDDAEVHRVLMEKVFPRQATVVSVDEWTPTN
jgi:nicotinamidase-related amidase